MSAFINQEAPSVAPMPQPFSRSFNQIIAGVCGGLAEHFHVSVTFVRIVFLVLALMQGLGVVLYFGLILIMPGPHVRLLASGDQGDELAKLLSAAQKPRSSWFA